MTTRSGIGMDVHPLTDGRDLILGGINIPFEKGLAGHSDGDVLIHSIIDALLGAAGMGDIGTHFPSGDDKYKGIASTILLVDTAKLLQGKLWRTTYVDATILAERPILRPFMDDMKQSIAKHIGIEDDSINLKATTTDGLGFLGHGEGIACIAIATIERVE